MEFLQTLWQAIREFFVMNPEFNPSLLCLGGLIVVYLIALVAVHAWIYIKRGAYPDEVLRKVLIVCVFAIVVIAGRQLLDLARNPLYFVMWYHWIVPGVIAALGVFMLASLFTNRWRAPRG